MINAKCGQSKQIQDNANSTEPLVGSQQNAEILWHCIHMYVAIATTYYLNNTKYICSVICGIIFETNLDVCIYICVCQCLMLYLNVADSSNCAMPPHIGRRSTNRNEATRTPHRHRPPSGPPHDRYRGVHTSAQHQLRHHLEFLPALRAPGRLALPGHLPPRHP